MFMEILEIVTWAVWAIIVMGVMINGQGWDCVLSLYAGLCLAVMYGELKWVRPCVKESLSGVPSGLTIT